MIDELIGEKVELQGVGIGKLLNTFTLRINNKDYFFEPEEIETVSFSSQFPKILFKKKNYDV